MESLTIQENIQIDVQNTEKDNQSSEQFKNFIYELFNKNGVFNDLRAYLRGHIVKVLTSNQAGETPVYQKRFTQRLDLTIQAVNMLIAEYLLRQEFQYSLSVFVSEIPLANMVFDFAKLLFENKSQAEVELLRFSKTDVCSILNYLGIKCDSTDVDKVIEMYTSPKCPPLLLCILKNVQLYSRTTERIVKVNSTKLAKSPGLMEYINTMSPRSPRDKCAHYITCKSCQSRIKRLRDKYAKKNKEHETMLIQLKAAYDSEIEMVREEERAKVDRMLENQAQELYEQAEEMKRRYSEREATLERGAETTRRFVRGLARRLRARLATVLNAATALRDERRQLTAKEEKIRCELKQAEEILTIRGEEMRLEISTELAALEGHLDAMKRERDAINRERLELESMKLRNCNREKLKEDDQELRAHYELIKEELKTLKEYLKTFKLQPKSMMDKAVLTEEFRATPDSSVRNEQDYIVSESLCPSVSRSYEKFVYNIREDDVLNSSTKVSSSRKMKNVISTVDADVQTCVEPGYMVTSRDSLTRIVEQLHVDDFQLKLLAAQQGSHMEYLSAQQAKLRAEMDARHAIRPALPVDYVPLQTSLLVNRASVGAGEGPRPRSPSPRSHAADERRITLNQWGPPKPLEMELSPRTAYPHLVAEGSPHQTNAHELKENDIISKSITKKAKPKSHSTAKRKPSYSSVLRDAKMRLRKLEIEAEAVEMSYIDFRAKQPACYLPSRVEPRQEITSTRAVPKMLDTTRSSSLQEFKKSSTYFEDTMNLVKIHKRLTCDYDQYLKKYNVNLGSGEDPKTITSGISKTTKSEYSNKANNMMTVNDYLLDTPLTEFRKLYVSDHSRKRTYSSESFRVKTNYSELSEIVSNGKDTAASHTDDRTSKEDIEKKVENAKIELQILERNLKEMYKKRVANANVVSDTDAEISKSNNTTNEDRDVLNNIHNGVVRNDNYVEGMEKIDFTILQPKRSPPIDVIMTPKTPMSPKKNMEKAVELDRTSNKEEVPSKLLNTKDNIDNVVNVIFTQVDNIDKESYSEDKREIYTAANSKDTPDDLSATNNYNRSDFESDSPISMAKYSEDENFWKT